MSRQQKLLSKILRGTSDKNFAFDDLRFLLISLGFDERIRGSHHIYTQTDVIEILNIQPNSHQAKPYQVKQVREIVLKYKLAEDNNAEE